MPREVTAVSESGLQSRRDLEDLRAQGYRAFLIGERFMTDPDPANAVAGLISPVAGTLSAAADASAGPRRSVSREGGLSSRGEPEGFAPRQAN
jgi:hypothetical protein